ncbi:MAG: hypothetical protein QOD97_2418, partial [Mycobacterium sp.]|nr:hypothetical protein [Mycobacterium sp.]
MTDRFDNASGFRAEDLIAAASHCPLDRVLPRQSS